MRRERRKRSYNKIKGEQDEEIFDTGSNNVDGSIVFNGHHKKLSKGYFGV